MRILTIDQNSCACVAPLCCPSPSPTSEEKKSDVITPVHFERHASNDPSSCHSCRHMARVSIKPHRKVRKQSKSWAHSSYMRHIIDLHVHTAVEPCSTSTSNIIVAKDQCENGAAQCSRASAWLHNMSWRGALACTMPGCSTI